MWGRRAAFLVVLASPLLFGLVVSGQGYGNLDDDVDDLGGQKQFPSKLQQANDLPQYVNADIGQRGSRPLPQGNAPPTPQNNSPPNLWWHGQNAFQRPPGHPGVQSLAPSSNPQTQSPQSNYNKPVPNFSAQGTGSGWQGSTQQPSQQYQNAPQLPTQVPREPTTHPQQFNPSKGEQLPASLPPIQHQNPQYNNSLSQNSPLQLNNSPSQQLPPYNRPPPQQSRPNNGPPAQQSPPNNSPPPQQYPPANNNPPPQQSFPINDSPPFQQSLPNNGPPAQQSSPNNNPPPQQYPAANNPPPQQSSPSNNPPPQQSSPYNNPLPQQYPAANNPPPQQSSPYNNPPPQQSSPYNNPPPQRYPANNNPPSQQTQPYHGPLPQQYPTKNSPSPEESHPYNSPQPQTSPQLSPSGWNAPNAQNFQQQGQGSGQPEPDKVPGCGLVNKADCHKRRNFNAAPVPPPQNYQPPPLNPEPYPAQSRYNNPYPEKPFIPQPNLSYRPPPQQQANQQSKANFNSAPASSQEPPPQSQRPPTQPSPLRRPASPSIPFQPRPQHSERQTFPPEVDPVPYPGCPAAMNCVQDEFCNSIGLIEENPIRLSAAEKLHRVALMQCSEPMTGRVGVCCRDPNYVDPWPDMNNNGIPIKNEGDYHIQKPKLPAQQGQTLSNFQPQKPIQGNHLASGRDTGNPYTGGGDRSNYGWNRNVQCNTNTGGRVGYN